MPEIVEVYKWKQELLILEDEDLLKLNILSISKKFILDNNQIEKHKIINVNRHGKYLYWEFDNSLILLFHFGLFGNFSLLKNNYSRLEFKFKQFNLFFNDKTNFGFVKVITKTQLNKYLETGYDLINTSLSIEQLKQQYIKYSDINICVFLLKQNIWAGAGNYIKNEILYKESISPFILIKHLTFSQFNILYNNLKQFILFLLECDFDKKIFPHTKFNKGMYIFLIYKQKFVNNVRIIKLRTPDKRSTYTLFSPIGGM